MGQLVVMYMIDTDFRSQAVGPARFLSSSSYRRTVRMASAGPSKRETVDERMFTTCTQTREGRAAGRPPNCRAVSIRYMSELEAQARAGASPAPRAAVP